MGMTLQSCVTEARGLLNDTTATYRYSDADLLQYANDALDELAANPITQHYFTRIGTMECVLGQTRQQVGFDDTLALVDIVRVVGGSVPMMADRATLDAFSPGWHSATSGAATNWFPDPTSKVRFYVYPPAPSGQELEVRYVAIPSEYAIGTDTGLPTTLLSPIADYICYRAELREDEYAVQGKALAFYQAFLSKVAASGGPA
jgi:hypothetical protein